MELSNFSVFDSDRVKWCQKLLDTVKTCEREEHIWQNMFGDVPWSLKNILVNRSRCSSGFISVMTEDERLIGIAGCEKSTHVFADGIQFGIRLWVHPDYRDARIPSALLQPAISWAQSEKTVAWTSFNSDRSAMLRMIRVRAAESNTNISNLWLGFEQLPSQQLVHNTLQWVAYKDFSKL